MTYFVKDECIKCKLMDCVEVCPVDCFYEGENMLVIDPDECIDCGVCEPECPVEAIVPDTTYEKSDKSITMDDIYVFSLVCLIFFSYAFFRIEQRVHERSYLHAGTTLITECVRVLPEIIKVQHEVSRREHIRVQDPPEPDFQNVRVGN